MSIKPVLVPDHTANDLRRLMDHFAEASTGPTRQELTESRAAVAAAQGVAEAAKWRTHPDAHDHDTDGSPMPKGGIKSDPLSIRQGVSRTQSEKDPKSLAGKFGDKYAKKHGVPTKQLMKNIPLDDIDKPGVAEGEGMSNHSKIMGLIRTYYNSMGMDFWPWFNEPGNKEFFARRINVSPEEAYEVVDSMDWGQVPHEDNDEDMKEGWKQKVAGAALAGAAALGAGGAQAQATDRFDPSWSTAGYDTHIRSDKSLTRSLNSADPSKDVDDFQKRIQSVKGPNAKGEYKVVVIQGNDIVSHYVTKTPPPGWLYKEDAEEIEESIDPVEQLRADIRRFAR
jgi:hypothetical protein